MNNVLTIMKRDVKSFYSSMTAYVVMMIFLGLVGYFFYSFVFIYARVSMYIGSDPQLAKGLNPMDSILRPLTMNLSIIMLLLLPILSMRSIAEEKKQGTIELLFTYPVKNCQIVLGKYLALLFVFFVMMVPTVIYPGLLMMCGAEFHLPSLLSAYLGILVLGSSFLALGLFSSSLTENQTIAAVLGFGSLLIFWLIGWSGDIVQSEGFARFLKEISMIEHYRSFIMGQIDTNDVLYNILFVIFFLYMTHKILEKRDWR